MAITIIKEGKVKYRLKCDTCGCVFECEEEDFETWYDPASAWGGCDVKCPFCGEKNRKSDAKVIGKPKES